MNIQGQSEAAKKARCKVGVCEIHGLGLGQTDGDATHERASCPRKDCNYEVWVKHGSKEAELIRGKSYHYIAILELAVSSDWCEILAGSVAEAMQEYANIVGETGKFYACHKATAAGPMIRYLVQPLAGKRKARVSLCSVGPLPIFAP